MGGADGCGGIRETVDWVGGDAVLGGVVLSGTSLGSRTARGSSTLLGCSFRMVSKSLLFVISDIQQNQCL